METIESLGYIEALQCAFAKRYRREHPDVETMLSLKVVKFDGRLRLFSAAELHGVKHDVLAVVVDQQLARH
jgi:hypothetical protein